VRVSIRGSGLLAVGVLVAAALLWSGGAAGAHGMGALELCKSSANGAVGQMFSFTATTASGASVAAAVKGGTCSEALPTPPGNYTILED